MIHVNHIAVATQNLYEAAARLRSETGFGFYDGGWSEAGVGSKIVPLGEGSYLQLSSLVNAFALKDEANAGAKRLYESAAQGDRFENLNLRVDTLEELERIGALHGMKPGHDEKRGRIRPSGEHIAVYGLTGGTPPAGMPNIYFFPDMTVHPSGQPVEPAYGLKRPLGIASVEVGGTDAQMTAWIGSPASQLPLRFNGKAPGIYSVAVKTETGDITIQRRPSTGA
jgi:hypothetical protein